MNFLFSRRTRRDEELDAEIQSHLNMAAREREARGETPRQARDFARREIGNVGLVKEVTREAWGRRWLQDVTQDLVYALRQLRRSPGFTAVAILTLALGIGANTAIFSVVYDVLLRPLPYPASDRVAALYLRFSPQNIERGPLSVADYIDLKARSRVYEQIGAYALNRFDLTGDGTAEQLFGASVTSEFFSILQVPPQAGRGFAPSDDASAAARVAVISDALWQRRYHGDPAILGRAIRLGGALHTVVGVMPPQFRMPTPEAEIWTNLRIAPPTRRGPFFLAAIARLAPGVTWKQAEGDGKLVAQSIENANSQQYSHLSVVVLPLREVLVGNARLPLLILLAGVMCVLLIAAANVANLLLARATVRHREIALRLCLGATRNRLFKQLLTESVFLALLGGGCGVLLAVFGIQSLRGWSAAAYVPNLGDVRLDWHVLGFAAGISIGTGIVFGILPGFRASRVALSSELKHGGRGSSAGADGALLGALIVVEVAVCVVLLVSGGLFLRTLLRLESVNLGISAPNDRVLLVRFSTPSAPPNDTKDLAGVRLYDSILQRVRQLPGVRAAALSDVRPPNYWAVSDTFQVEGQIWNEQSFPSTPLPDVSEGYFETLGIPLLRGRLFNPDDTPDSQTVGVVSAELARRYFNGVDPIGRYLNESGPGSPGSRRVQIVGVVADVPYNGLNRGPEPVFYEPMAQAMFRRAFLVVRTEGDPQMLATTITRELQNADSNLVVSRVTTLADTLSEAVNAPRFLTALVGGFAILALLLASIGLYGVISYLVGQRTHEIGIRMALGAKPWQVLAMVIRRGATLAFVGAVFGTVVAVGLTRYLGTLLYHVKPADPITLIAVTAILMIVALAASYIPARRATKVDPLVALRHE